MNKFNLSYNLHVTQKQFPNCIIVPKGYYQMNRNFSKGYQPNPWLATSIGGVGPKSQHEEDEEDTEEEEKMAYSDDEEDLEESLEELRYSLKNCLKELGECLKECINLRNALSKLEPLTGLKSSTTGISGV